MKEREGKNSMNYLSVETNEKASKNRNSERSKYQTYENKKKGVEKFNELPLSVETNEKALRNQRNSERIVPNGRVAANALNRG